MIKVSNGVADGWNSGHYIGRGGKGKKSSALANPFKLQDIRNNAERDRVIAEYRRWLWNKILTGDSGVMTELSLLKQQAMHGDVQLLCFCKPLACHGDVIKSCLEWMIHTSSP